MDIPDAAVGKTILTTTTAIFLLLAFWVNTYPFIDEGFPFRVTNLQCNTRPTVVSTVLHGLGFIIHRGSHVVHSISHIPIRMTMATRQLNSQWVVIGVSGVTCGGKTTLANRLQNCLSPVYVFNQDKYFYPDDSEKHVKCEGLDHNNYDILSSLDMEAMYGDILKTMDGDNKAHSFSLDTDGKFTADGKKFLVVEGFTVLNYKPILDICNLRYYIVLERGECMARRALRLYEPPDVAGYFERCVWPEHVRHRAEIERDARVTLLDGRRQDALDLVLADLGRACALTPPPSTRGPQ